MAIIRKTLKSSDTDFTKINLFEKQILPLKSKPLAEESLSKARNLEHSLFMSRQLLFHFGCLGSVRAGLVSGRQLNAWDFLVCSASVEFG